MTATPPVPADRNRAAKRILRQRARAVGSLLLAVDLLAEERARCAQFEAQARDLLAAHPGTKRCPVDEAAWLREVGRTVAALNKLSFNIFVLSQFPDDDQS